MFLRLVTGLCLLEIVFGAFCDRTFTSSYGTVTSLDYQPWLYYANNLNCQYDIRVGSGNAVRLTWTSFDIKGKMPSCDDDYVEIFIGCNRRSIGRYCSENSDAYTPFDVYSPDNCLQLKFKSDSSGTGKGFTATYSTVSYFLGTISLSSSCPSSDSRYLNSGVINSPRWPRVYTTIGSCYWKIEVGSNKAVKIAFMDFELDFDFGCDDDKVTVKGGRRYDSYDDSSTVNDSMCGSKSPFYFTSTKERIWIRFKSDGSTTNRGFVAGYVTYDLDSSSCDRTFTSSSGTVTSPSVYYANNLNCQYDIRVDSGNAIRLTWTSFDIKGKMPSCYTDYVEIFIGCNRRSIGRYCSENSDAYTPFDVYSPDNCLRLKFKSDGSGTGLGFRATYSKVSYFIGTISLSSSCPSSDSRYLNSGVISSPRWPRVYTSTGFGSCYWKIEVGSNKAVKIAFMDFDLDYDFGCDADKVQVKGGRRYDSYDDSSTVNDSMCGSKSPFYFTSTKERIWIRFKSDGSTTNRGFVAGYVTYDFDSSSCDRTFTSSSETVTSPSVYYANNLNCQYDIRVDSGNAVRLTWTSFDIKGKMPSCDDDYVEIFIGCNRRSIGRYCSENSDAYTPFDVYSPDNCLRLKFKSDSSGTGRGFTATYSTVSYFLGTSSLSSSCSSSESKYSNSGVINSPRWPRVYTTSSNCYWKIEVGSNKAVKIAFMDFDLEYDFGCDDDKVKVKGGHRYDSYDDSSTVKDSMCGSKSPFYFTSTKERIWIRFKSDGSTTNRGFVAGYVTYDLDSSSSGSTSTSTSTSVSPAVVIGIVVSVIVCICIGGIIYYIFVYRKRVTMRQVAHRQAMTTQVNVASQQAVVHHPPPPTQPGYGPPPPAGYGLPPPVGYVPPPVHPGVAPPPYSEVVGAPYPQHDKSGPYSAAGAAPYPLGQAGGPPFYLPGQPGGMAPYPPEPSSGAAPYATGTPGAAPYPRN